VEGSRPSPRLSLARGATRPSSGRAPRPHPLPYAPLSLPDSLFPAQQPPSPYLPPLSTSPLSLGWIPMSGCYRSSSPEVRFPSPIFSPFSPSLSLRATPPWQSPPRRGCSWPRHGRAACGPALGACSPASCTQP
jgi:hypothetical protein